eukprot:365719-Chlamydomonas_euryale.AAC.6
MKLGIIKDLDTFLRSGPPAAHPRPPTLPPHTNTSRSYLHNDRHGASARRARAGPPRARAAQQHPTQAPSPHQHLPSTPAQ